MSEAPSDESRIVRSRRPYILLTRLAPSDQVWLRRLTDVRDALIGPPTTTGGSVVWRLFSAQHRQLGTSARLFSSLEEARLDANRVARAGSALVVRRIDLEVAHGFAWTISLDELPVVVPTHLFETGYDSNKHAASTLRALATAEVARSFDAKMVGHVAGRPVSPA